MTANLEDRDGRIISLSQDVFRVDYIEPIEELELRFGKWLDDVIIRGLAEWRKTLV